MIYIYIYEVIINGWTMMMVISYKLSLIIVHY